MMNASDMLKYGHLSLLSAVEKIPVESCETGGVCGIWSVKDIMLHLLSYEEVLVEILSIFLDKEIETPVLDRMMADYQGFNDKEVVARQHLSWQEVINSYFSHHEKTIPLMDAIPLELRRKNGALAWYGDEYDLEDFIAYTYYGHKREHSAQINVFADNL